MFGYVIIDKPNILIKDYQTYRAYYCGLCKSIGKQSGSLMRLTLNYDIVFLALLAHNIEDKDPEFKKGHCYIHPIRKIEYIEPNDITLKIADINTILGYYKVLDDVIDNGKHRGIKSAIKPYYKKAKKRMPEFDSSCDRCYTKLRELEKEKADIETLSDCFGEMLMSAADAVTNKADVALRKLLFYIGKWIYVIDAYDDIKKDFKNKDFNPFLYSCSEVNDAFFEKTELKARELIYDFIDKIQKVYETIKIEISEGPLSNVIYRGLKYRTEDVLKRRGEKWEKIRI